MTDAEAAARVVTENEVRADTNVMDKAAGYKRLTQPPCSFTLEEIAKRYGYPAATLR
jgi:ParB-like chromosome segregation protein Spo0J